MDTLHIVALAILQGVTEFLPVSSSGHLAIAQRCLKMDAPGNTLEILLHFGTFLAVLWFYRTRIALLLSGVARGDRQARRYAISVAVGCIPAVVAYFCFKDFFEACFDKGLAFTGSMLVITGIVLLSLKLVKKSESGEIGIWRAFLVGLAQAMALLPGISRSGSTIAAARHLGVDAKESADFSFMMTLPLLLGASVTPFLSHGSKALSDIGAVTALIAVAVSAVTGYVSLKFLIKILGGGRFWLFGLYCLAAGAISIAVAL